MGEYYEIQVTRSCNYSCKVCKKAFSEKKELSIEQIQEEVKRARKEFPHKQILFTGGEPFFSTSFFSYFEGIKPIEGKYLIRTNGSLLSPGWIAEHKRNLGGIILHFRGLSYQTCRKIGFLDSGFLQTTEHIMSLKEECKKCQIPFFLSYDGLWEQEELERITLLIQKCKPARLYVKNELSKENKDFFPQEIMDRWEKITQVMVLEDDREEVNQEKVA